MSNHFRAFSFVDRIVAVQPGAHAAGRYTIPADVDAFSGSLVAEATGQLAAWSAMAAVDFAARPVAGIAGLVELLGTARPGDTLDLAIQIDSVDVDAISYGGTASIAGQPVLRLEHCVGPMLPVEDFDDPQALRERYALLCGEGAEPGAFRGLPRLPLENLDGETGRLVRATLQVPEAAPFFDDHFPRRPVFPGSLLMQCNLELVARLAADLPRPAGAPAWRLHCLSNMKLRTFIPQGEQLDLEASLLDSTATTATIAVESRRGKRPVGAATVSLTLESPA